MAADPKNQGSQKTAKQLAAEARAASEAEERRRERLIRIIGVVVVVLVVGGLLAVGFFAGRGNDADTAFPPPQPDPNAALPQGVTSDTYGVKYGSGWTSADEAKLPTLEIWEDFQCPACAQVEAMSGQQLQALADEGKVKLLYRPATFLDRNPIVRDDNIANGNPNSSAHATAAWGCAIDQGKAGEYHNAVFAAQPDDEGVGYSQQALIDLGTQVGVADQPTFASCVQQGTYLAWSANSDAEFTKVSEAQDAAGNKRFGTPAAFLNGTLLDNSQLADIETMTQLIADATAQ